MPHRPRPALSSIPAAAMLLAAALLAVAASGTAAEPIQLHPRGEVLPFDHQGPFVTTGDGGVLAVGRSSALVSHDEGKSWQTYALFGDNGKHEARDERALLKLRDGSVVMAWMNERERKAGAPWGAGGETEAAQWVLPVYISRSTDDGRTWTEPLKIQDRWCGAIRSLIQLESGRLVLVAQKVIPWRHVTLTYVSDDNGASWTASNVLDIEMADGGDHSGTMEGTVTQLADGRVYMLIRTTRGWFWEAFSSDGGMTWDGLAQAKIRASTCCGQLARLDSGRLVLLWNRPSDDEPPGIHSRRALSLAFSGDEAATWTDPIVASQIVSQPGEKPYTARQSYPYIYERRPGELWITTMQGNLRMKIADADLR